jgi:hypothetical protein
VSHKSNERGCCWELMIATERPPDYPKTRSKEESTALRV